MSVPDQPIDVGEYVLHGSQTRDVLSTRPPRLGPQLTRLLRNIAAIASVLAVVIVGGGAVVAYRTLSGGGPQPEKYAPASTFAFTKVDLDPAAGEKVAAYRFARKFPGSVTSHVKSSDDLRDRLLTEVFKDSSDPHVDYAKDIKPWLGARVGVAGFIDKAKHPQALGIAAVKDATKARKSLARLATDNAPFAYTVKSDFALLAANQAALDDALRQDAQATLDHSTQFRGDMHRLGSGQLVTAWADLAKVSAVTHDLLGTLLSGGFVSGFGSGVTTPATPDRGRTTLSPQCLQELQRITGGPATNDPLSQLSGRCRRELLGNAPGSPGAVVAPTSYAAPVKATATTKLSGRLALGIHLHSDSAELVVHMVATKHDTAAHSVRDLVTSLPDDTVGAFGASGVSSIQRGYKDPANDTVRNSITQSLAVAGVDLKDLLASFGDSVVMTVGNVPDEQHPPQIALRTRSPQPSAAQRVVAQLNKTFAKEGSSTRLVIQSVHGDLVVTNAASYAAKLQTTGHLGDQKRFKSAVGPLSGTVLAIGYVDLRRILAAQPDHGGAAHALTAAGFTLVDTGSETVLRVRLLAG